jgi:hypothetical protein
MARLQLHSPRVNLSFDPHAVHLHRILFPLDGGTRPFYCPEWQFSTMEFFKRLLKEV